MFCKDNNYPDSHLQCPVKLISEIISFLSIIFSTFIILVTKFRINSTLVTDLIIQIMISEVVDGICILFEIIRDYYGKRYFENFNTLYFYCFSQIYLSVFSCLWTLTASFFISLRIYDIAIKRNQIFKYKFWNKLTPIISICIPAILSFIIWAIQVVNQSIFIKNTSENIYNIKSKSHHFKHMYCWVEGGLNIMVVILVFLLIFANFYLSVIRSYRVLSKISKEVNSPEIANRKGIKEKINMINQIKKSLVFYPLVSGIIWGAYFIFQLITRIGTAKYGLLSVIYCILISTRQPIYACLFLFTQPKMKEFCLKTLKCEFSKKKERVSLLVNNMDVNSNVLPDKDERDSLI